MIETICKFKNDCALHGVLVSAIVVDKRTWLILAAILQAAAQEIPNNGFIPRITIGGIDFICENWFKDKVLIDLLEDARQRIRSQI